MDIILGNAANKVRENYINRFIDTNDQFYLDRIKKCRLCSDGVCYTGYLWDCLKKLTVVTEEETFDYLKLKKNIYVFWDIHSRDRIFIRDYWKYPKTAVLRMTVDEFFEKLNTFPEDIYVLDESLEWSVILTHETYIHEERYCLLVS